MILVDDGVVRVTKCASAWVRCGEDLVMSDHTLKAHQCSSSLGFHDRTLRLVAGEGADRVHGFPEGQHEKLDLLHPRCRSRYKPLKPGSRSSFGRTDWSRCLG
jgi:hypothetical protein